MKFTSYDIYVFVLCLIVFALLTALFTTMIAYIARLFIRLIRSGAEDEKIKIEYSKKKKCSKCLDVISLCFSILICAALTVALVFSLIVGASEEDLFEAPISLKVVKSESMATKHEGNTYLDFYGLNDQFQMFDLIVTHEMPPESELELHDIVVYEINNMMIIHRIVGIEEPNEEHPDERYFLVQGDANEVPDRFPVLYSQMRGVYRGERVPFVGSFIMFMQSPAGWICIVLLLFGIIATPILEKKIENEKKKRWLLIRKQEILQKYSMLEDKQQTVSVEKEKPRLELSKLYFLRLNLRSSKHPNCYKQYTLKFAKTNFFNRGK
ncbi:MAG: hypothetical protein IJX19_02350 [Clostridia bacterium]|nr:hypothetical protein [Clostridia bacterium]